MKTYIHKLDKTLYFIGIVLLFLAIPGIPLLEYVIIPNMGYINPQCVMLTLTGIYCPGCGGTRALECLFHGEILQSIWYHPLVIYSVIIYLIFMITHTLERLHVGSVKGIHFRPGYLYWALTIVVVNFIVKNILKLFFAIQMI